MGDFKINAFFQKDGEEVEQILARYLIRVLENNSNYFFKAWKEEQCLKK